MTRKSSTWADYYSRRRVLLYTLLLGPLCMLAAEAWFQDLTNPLVVFAVWMVASLLAGLHLQAFACPRCDHKFFPRKPLLGLWAKRCSSCMLPKD
ncbi:MAG: hypothetical protein ABIQ62_10230 [Thermomonas sp.]